MRRSPGDESLVWTRLCTGFPEYAAEADRFGIGGRWRDLVDGVRRGTARAREVRLFLAELAERRGHLEDFAGRDGTWSVTTEEDAAPGAYACPAGRCRRRDAVLLGPPPRCAAFDRAMVDPIG
ncbi:hypothetical protein ACQPZF_27750 [Actinosynnema sp. CS-041913]|uniref:hypothetical protein n=1 Tax=Actinosynnema sp. CS-041913 TaxID=3239917 RepID=UPI003D937E0D